MKRFGSPASLYFENGRFVDPVEGERHGTLRIAHGRIDALDAPPRPGDRRFNLDGALVLPGLINAHDHLELNNFPRLKFRERYDNAREWANDHTARLDHDPVILAARRVPLADRLGLSALKNLLAGATTVAHHNPYHAPLRRNYPVHIVSPYGWTHSLYLSPDFAQSYQRTPRAAPWMIHLAEGTDAEAQGELARLDAAGALQANTVLIHGVGLSTRARARMLEQRASLVWCPSSNFFLLGATADVRDLSTAHRLAVGSDSRLTGERDLLDELRAARATGQLGGAALLRAVTSDAAAILRAGQVGRLAPGYRADLIILPKSLPRGEDAFGAIRRAGLRAVLVDGAVQVADPDFADILPGSVCFELDGRPKLLAPAFAARIRQSALAEPGLIARSP